MPSVNVHNAKLNARPEPAADAPQRPQARIAAVSYLNTLPLIEGLGKLRDVSLTLAPPAALLDLLLAGEVDVALAPVIEAARAAEPLAVAPVGGIGSQGATLTVRLFSAAPIACLSRVHADVESRTSVALLRVLLRELHNLDVAIEPIRAPQADWPEAVLLIGDKVETSPPSRATHPHTLDLGKAWSELTGLPFVYALWICREPDASSDAVRLACTVLDRQRRHNATRLEWIAAARGPERGWPVADARSYLAKHLRFDVAHDERRAIELFLERARALGLAPGKASAQPIRWLAPEDWRLPNSPCLH